MHFASTNASLSSPVIAGAEYLATATFRVKKLVETSMQYPWPGKLSFAMTMPSEFLKVFMV